MDHANIKNLMLQKQTPVENNFTKVFKILVQQLFFRNKRLDEIFHKKALQNVPSFWNMESNVYSLLLNFVIYFFSLMNAWIKLILDGFL